MSSRRGGVSPPNSVSVSPISYDTTAPTAPVHGVPVARCANECVKDAELNDFENTAEIECGANQNGSSSSRRCERPPDPADEEQREMKMVLFVLDRPGAASEKEGKQG